MDFSPFWLGRSKQKQIYSNFPLLRKFAGNLKYFLTLTSLQKHKQNTRDLCEQIDIYQIYTYISDPGKIHLYKTEKRKVTKE